MKTIKYTFGLLLSLITIASMSSCSEDEAVYTPGKPAAVETQEYYFAEDTETALTIGVNDKEITFVVNRANTETDATLDLIVTNPNEEFFTIPENVSFKAGETTAEVKIQVSDDIEYFKNYKFAIEIPEEFTNPYVAENNNPKLDFVVMRDDYTPWATGVYSSYFFEEKWNAVLEYSEFLGLFRFKDCWMPGYHVTFEWDMESPTFTMTSGAFASGYVHPSYGMVTAEVYNKGALNEYDAEKKTFYFAYTWKVSAGSFGSGYDSFTITE